MVENHGNRRLEFIHTVDFKYVSRLSLDFFRDNVK